MTLTEFLLARIAEDEEDALSAVDDYPTWTYDGAGYLWQASATTMTSFQGLDRRPQAGEHIARWDPARVLAECAAKRQIVDHARLWSAPDKTGPRKGLVRSDSYAVGVQYGAEIVLLQLAQPYADHADFDPGWRL